MNKILLIILTIVTFNPIQPAQDLPQSVLENVDIECPICLENILPISAITNLQCNHTFHIECIEIWLISSHACPLCKSGNRDAENPDPMLALFPPFLDLISAQIQLIEAKATQIRRYAQVNKIALNPEVDAPYRYSLAKLRELLHKIEMFVRIHELRDRQLIR